MTKWETARKWNEFKEQVPIIKTITHKRWYEYESGMKAELHGFSDASEKAMGACVYLKVFQGDEICVNLVAGKAKVAPMKTISLPKLELCAAVLLAKLMKNVKNALKININETHFYSDSEITLAWIKKEPHVWKTFVANRVSKIHELSERNNWHYINTKANPADHASRGSLPIQLKDNKLWWYGPSVLMNEEECAPERVNEIKLETDLEQKKIKITALHLAVDAACNHITDTSFIEKISTLEKAIKVTAYCKRYMFILRERKSIQRILKKEEVPECCKQEALTVEELENAKITIIRLYQAKHFGEEIEKLKEKQKLPKNNQAIFSVFGQQRNFKNWRSTAKIGIFV